MTNWTMLVLKTVIVSIASLLIGCDFCDTIGETKCVGNEIHICMDGNAERSERWGKMMNCSESNSTCKVVDNTSFITLVDGVDGEYIWPDGRTAVCVLKDEECPEVDRFLCASDSMFKYVCVEDGDERIPLFYKWKRTEHPLCTQTDTDAVFAYDTDTCEDGMTKCGSDTQLLL